jgi:hypothetical protein
MEMEAGERGRMEDAGRRINLTQRLKTTFSTLLQNNFPLPTDPDLSMLLR